MCSGVGCIPQTPSLWLRKLKRKLSRDVIVSQKVERFAPNLGISRSREMCCDRKSRICPSSRNVEGGARSFRTMKCHRIKIA